MEWKGKEKVGKRRVERKEDSGMQKKKKKETTHPQIFISSHKQLVPCFSELNIKHVGLCLLKQIGNPIQLFSNKS